MMVFCGPSSAADSGEAGLTGGMSREAGLAARSEARHSAERGSWDPESGE